MGKDAAYSSSAAIFAPKLPAVTRHTAAFTGFTPTNSWKRKGRQPHWNNLNHGLSQNTDSQSDVSVVLLHEERLGDIAVGGAGT